MSLQWSERSSRCVLLLKRTVYERYFVGLKWDVFIQDSFSTGLSIQYTQIKHFAFR